MALKWIEGFETFGSTNGVALSNPARKYEVTGPSVMLVDTGRIAGTCCRFDSNSAILTTPNLTTNATLIVGVALKVSAYPSANDQRIISLRGGGTENINVRMRTNGEFSVFRGNTSLVTTTGAAPGIDTWFYLELKVLTANTGGTYELRINGVNVASSGSADTQDSSTAYSDSVRFQAPQTNGDLYIDDWYVCDGSGTANNNFLGSQKVEAIYPNAEGATINFTPSTGTDNSALIDENPSNSDTDYVESGTVTNKDTYDYSALASISAGIKGVQINTEVRETDATPFSLISVIRSNLTESDDAGQAIGSSTYVNRHRISETDPNTAIAWTAAGINAAQFGIKVA